jgi:putative SOS response-associated peptidase YedK
MAVLRRDQRMAWLDRTCLEEELLRPLPAGTFVVSQPREAYGQAALAF